MRKKPIDIGGSAAIALFILAVRMLKVENADEGSWQTSFWLTLFAFVLAVAVIPLIILASCELFAEKRGLIDRIVTVVVSIILVIAAVYTALIITVGGVEFVTRSMDISLPGAGVAAILLAVGGYMAGFEGKALKKFALVTYAFAALSSGVLLIIALCRGGFTDGSILKELSWGSVGETVSVNAIVSRFLGVIAPSVIAAAWLGSEGSRKKGVISGLSGILMGGIGLLICYISTESVLGMEYASLKTYPYLSAVGSITAGKLFFRPEGFVYLSYLWVTVLSVAVCLSLICRLIDRHGRMKKRLSLFTAAFTFAIYLIFFGEMM